MDREERIYSVTITENEFKLFSEFLEQREYAGLVKLQNKAIKRDFFLNYSPYTYHGKPRPNKEYKKLKKLQERRGNDSEWLSYQKKVVDNSLTRRRKNYATRDSSGNLALPLDLESAYGSKMKYPSTKSDINYRINVKSKELGNEKNLYEYISENFGKKKFKGVVKRLSKSNSDK